MTLFLNYLPWLVTVATLLGMMFFLFKKDNVGLAIATWALGTSVVLFCVVSGPSYWPKGEPVVTTIPDFEAKELPVQDNLLKAVPAKEQEAKLNEKLDWRKEVKENKDGT